MKCVFVTALLVGSLLAVVSVTSEAQTKNKAVLLIAREGSENLDLMLTKELMLMKSIIEKSGLTVPVATDSGALISSASARLKPDLKLADVDASRYDGVIIARMAAGIPGFIPSEAIRIVQDIYGKGLPFAAQNGAVSILNSAGLLRGKRYSTEGPYAQGLYSGTGVTVDGNLITSGTCPFVASPGRPDCTRELTKTFVKMVVSEGDSQ